jgi:asparagine synthase (glutamine-hydrolysing)
MSGIYGIIRHDGAPVALPDLETMRAAMAHWSRDGGDLWYNGPSGLGQLRTFTTPEARFESLPRAENGIVFTAAGRVDNRDELIANLRLTVGSFGATNHQSPIPDGDLLLAAYQKWGQSASERIYGDWAFAAWHPAERKLFLARDHFGNTSLYYYANPRVFAFASDRRALLALNLTPVEMDELYLAQILVSWFAYHGERTIHSSFKRLPPAHTLTITPERLDVRQYWYLEHTPELRLPKRQDYVEAFLEIFDTAVSCRLRTYDPHSSPLPSGEGVRLPSPEGRGACPEPVEEVGGEGKVGVTLSGGLDSSSVAVTAAGILRACGARLAAYTSVPLYDTSTYVGERFGDELPYAQSVAQFAGNVDLYPIRAESLTPIRAIRHLLPVFNEPSHTAGNFYWLLELQETARAQGCRALLTGQTGNLSISWMGDPFSQPLLTQLRHLGWRGWGKEKLGRAKNHLRATVSPGLLAAYRHLRRRDDSQVYRDAAIHPAFARRLNLQELRQDDPDSKPPRSPQEQRCRLIQPGRSFVGAIHAEMGAAFGLEIRDPTADARLLAFTLSVPDHIFIDPQTGLDRWLIRAAMKGRLPDNVRLNHKRGRQAGDRVPRLRASATEVETALDELARGPAAAYLDMAYMRDVWRMVQRDNTPEAFRKSGTVLTRGIMAGLWVNGFASGEW